MCLDLDNSGHCESELLFNTHDYETHFQFISTIYTHRHTHIICPIHFFYQILKRDCARFKNKKEILKYESPSSLECDLSFTSHFQACINLTPFLSPFLSLKTVFRSTRGHLDKVSQTSTAQLTFSLHSSNRKGHCIHCVTVCTKS